MIPRILHIGIAVAMLACAAPQGSTKASTTTPTTTTAKPASSQADRTARSSAAIHVEDTWEHEYEREYAEGLATALSEIGAHFDHNWITFLYRLGYRTGRDEADAYYAHAYGRLRQSACIDTIRALRKHTGTIISRNDTLALCTNHHPPASYHDTSYEQKRLDIAKTTSELGYHSIEIKASLAVFSQGYRGGFRHVG